MLGIYVKEAGLYVIARLGPYCYAEINGGGCALWGSHGSLGVRDETYHQAWLWFTKIGQTLSANQITLGGVGNGFEFSGKLIPTNFQLIILSQVENKL